MKKQKTIAQGAEAIIYLEKDKVTKNRISKAYRHPELDKKIIKKRTKAETKILKKASKIINAPEPKEQEEHNLIEMPYIDGLKLSEHLNSFPEKKQKKIMFQIGQSTSKLHQENIIHGDLTTSNMILKENEIYFIDFGLGYLNGKYEDKGVDIHLLKQALEAKHFKNWKTLFKEFEKGYKSIELKEAKKVFDRMKAIEKRGRYKH
jgi:TP53 regulating kinase and related kinases